MFRFKEWWFLKNGLIFFKWKLFFAENNQVHNLLSASFALCIAILCSSYRYSGNGLLIYFRINTIFPSIQAALKKREQSLQVGFFIDWLRQLITLKPTFTHTLIILLCRSMKNLKPRWRSTETEKEQGKMWSS